MTIYVGSARIDERGKTHGGAAGDQTGREVSTQPYYRHKKGWIVLRPKTAKQANMIARNMKYACKNNHIGYDQYQRGTLYAAVKDMGFDCSKVNKNCETDCSALVRVCCAYAGIHVENFRTINQRSVLIDSGQFDDVTAKVNTSTGHGLCIGDVLVTKTAGHTVVVTSGATKREDINPKALEFQKAYNLDYNGKLAEDGDEGPKTKEAEAKVHLRALDKDHKNMVKFIQKHINVQVDGYFGSQTREGVMDWQSKHGLKVDGIVGPETLHSIINS